MLEKDGIGIYVVEPNNDPCVPTADASTMCGQLADIEGSGAYTQSTHGTTGASGRYQMTQVTAVEQMINQHVVNSNSDGVALWQKCRSSSATECKALQDQLCNSYSTQLSKTLQGDERTIRNLYLRWNMGATGAGEILKAHNTTGKVTNPARIELMNNQAWMKGNPGNGETAPFLEGLNEFIKQGGVDPNATV